MASTPPTEDAFVREVDDELRREQLQSIWQHYGRIALVVVVLSLAAFAAFLWWRAEQVKTAERQGEEMGALIADVQANRKAEANAKIEKLIAEGRPGYRTGALLTKAALAADAGDSKGAIAVYAQIAADEDAAQPYRDLALIRQTLLEYDGLKPDQVIDRMKPLVVEGGGFFATAGELTALAMLQLGRGAEAGRLLAQIARDKDAPATTRARAARLATSLGVTVELDAPIKE